jgi:hypothetical protein
MLTMLWTSGATGALPSYPSGFTRATDEITAITRTGTGAMTIALGSPWAGPMFGNPIPYLLQATYSAAGACDIMLIEDHSNNVTTPEIKILFVNAAGAAVDPSNGDIVGFTMLPQIVAVQ